MDLTKRFPCANCNREFSNIARHQRNCKKRSVEDNRFKGRGVIDRKLKTKKCVKCNIEFANINRHKKLCKGPKIVVNCPLSCGKELLSVNLEKHLKSCKKKTLSETIFIKLEIEDD